MTEQVFVARERELTQLNTFLDRALAGHGQICFVTGEAGAGKTALVTEFARRAQAQHADLLVAVGQGDAQTGAGDPYLLFREVLGMLTGDVEGKLAQGAISQENAGRLQDFLNVSGKALVDFGPDLIDIFVPGAGLVTRAAGLVAGKAGWLGRLEEMTEQRTASRDIGMDQSRIFEQYTNVLKALAAERPMIVVVDDLQWADAASINLLFRLGRQIEDSRILILGTYRPADVALGRDGQQHPLEDVISEFKRYFGDIWIPLEQTDEARGWQFVDALLDAVPNRLDEAFRQALFRHTRGHPLFTTELLRDMQERGDLARDEQGRWIEGPALDWETLPARVEGVIEKRIGRLDQELREALTTASVEGEEFIAEVVAQVQDVDERGLVRRLSRELDRQHRLVEAQGQQRRGRQRLSLYRFRHNLFQKYLYNSLDEVDRSYLHEDVGTVLEELYGEQAGEIAVQLGHHFLEAGLKEKALVYLMQAGDKAARVYANEEAITAYRQALSFIDEIEVDGQKLIELFTNLGRALELNAQIDEALVTYEEMERMAKQQGDQSMQLAARMAQLTLRVTLTGRYKPEQSRSLLEETLILAHDLGQQAAEAKLLWLLLHVYANTDCIQQAIDCGERSLVLARALNLPEQIAYSLHDLGSHCYHKIGDFKTSKTMMMEARDLWRELGNLPMLADSLSTLCHLFIYTGEFDQGIAFSEEAYHISRSINNVWGMSYSLFHKGFVYQELGRLDLAIAAMKECIYLADLADFIVPRISTRADLAAAYGALGAVEHGFELAHQALSIAQTQEPHFQYNINATLIQLHLLNGHLDKAVLTAASETGRDIFVHNERYLLLTSQLALYQDNYEEVIKLTDEVRQTGRRPFIPHALYLQSQALLALSQNDRARDCLLEARAEAEAMGAKRPLWRILFVLSQLEPDPTEAEALRRHAREIALYIADHAGEPKLRTSFLHRPEVRAVFQ